MFDWRHFFGGLFGLVDSLLIMYTIVILVRVVASWLGADPYNPIIQFLARLTDPFFAAIRRRLPAALWNTGLDFSPLVAILLLQIVSILLNSFNFR